MSNAVHKVKHVFDRNFDVEIREYYMVKEVKVILTSCSSGGVEGGGGGPDSNFRTDRTFPACSLSITIAISKKATTEN